jgi:hypothetical protein
MKFQAKHAEDLKRTARLLIKAGKGLTEISRKLGVPRATIWEWRNKEATPQGSELPQTPDISAPQGTDIEDSDNGKTKVITCRSTSIKSVQDALEAAEVDQGVWEVERYLINKWDQGSKLGKAGEESIAVTPLWQVKIWLRRKTADVTSLESLLAEIRKGPVVLPVYKRPTRKGSEPRRALEISIMDPHLGMHCFKPESHGSWSLDECEEMFKGTTDRLLELAEPYGPFEEIVVPMGNDFLHADGVYHETTAGTPQPEMDSLHEVYVRGKKLLLWQVERLRQVAPVRVLSIPGNHDRVLSFTLGQLLEAYYAGAKSEDVKVDASAAPYKTWAFGVNLLLFEHGHSINAVRLAALLANETRLTGWDKARYCEVHCGDQHRKGSAKPSSFEEMGVSTEFLPGLTQINSWHKVHAYSWQKRGAMGFIWDHDRGPIARLQCNIDSYSNWFMGETR